MVPLSRVLMEPPAGLMGCLRVLLLDSWLCPWQPQGRTLSHSCCLLLSSKRNHSGTFSAG